MRRVVGREARYADGGLDDEVAKEGVPDRMGSSNALPRNILQKKLSNMLSAELSNEYGRKLGMLESDRTPHGGP